MSSIVIASLLIYTGTLILNKDSALTGSFLIAYIAIFSQLIPPAKGVTEAFFRLKKGAASLDRINDVLMAETEKDTNGVPAPLFSNQIKLSNVNFGYGDGPLVLKDINLTIKKGERGSLGGFKWRR